MFIEFTSAGAYKRPVTINSDKIVSITPRGNVDDDESMIVTVDAVIHNVNESYSRIREMLGIDNEMIND